MNPPPEMRNVIRSPISCLLTFLNIIFLAIAGPKWGKTFWSLFEKRIALLNFSVLPCFATSLSNAATVLFHTRGIAKKCVTPMRLQTNWMLWASYFGRNTNPLPKNMNHINVAMRPKM